MSLRFHFIPETEGVIFTLSSSSLFGSPTRIPPSQWGNRVSGMLRGSVSLARRLHEEYPGPERPDGLFFDHPTIAGLCQSHAQLLGLPPITPLNLSLQSWGNISQPEFRIDISWLTPQGLRAIGAERMGAMLQYQGEWQRLPHTLYALCQAVDTHNALPPEASDERRKYLSYITEALPEEARKQIRKDGFLSSLRVYHAAALSLRLSTRNGEFDFLPVLFGQHGVMPVHGDDEPEAQDSAQMPTEAESLLPPDYQAKFLQHFTHTYPTTRASYVLGDNRYVFLEPMLQEALEVIRRMRQADTNIRREFIRTPQRFFKEALATRYSEAALEAMFVPTQEYSERVVGLRLWIKKTLPWVSQVSDRWIPEFYGVRVDNAVTVIPDSTTAAKNCALVSQAMTEGRETVTITGVLPEENSTSHEAFSPDSDAVFIDQVEAAATQETLETLTSIRQLLQAKEQADEQAEQKVSDQPIDSSVEKSEPVFLDTVENLEIASYCKFRPRSPEAMDFFLPVNLKTSLKPHQIEGLEWLIRMWSAGYSGALLADDMGLGKTLTCLAFMMWLHQRRQDLGRKPYPMLIVVPTSLLGNWQAEAALHLHEPGLGTCLVVRGAQLQSLRLHKETLGRDIDDGTSRLDTTRLSQADWIVVTYETLRDYHHSFATIPLALVVFDEMQKAKNPMSQISNAIRVLNAEFSLGLTGTPIENTLVDLWTLMDVLLPGFLGELRQFNSRYCDPTKEELQALKDKLEGNPQDELRPMLRRMKTDTLQGLPAKHEHVIQGTMSKFQSEAYEKVLCEHTEPLRLLHALRMVSLHPLTPNQASTEEYQTVSARFAATLHFLDTIYTCHEEKVLLFLESREHQPALAVLLQDRYKLSRLPMIINGQTPAAVRQKYVQCFQNERGHFDVMILSPKAAGVGLTLTAANHVIHLSRWWNPAVEDQCTDRIYRLGQDRDVHVYYPLAVHSLPHLREYSFDLQLHHLLEQKRTLSREVLMPPQTGTEAAELFTNIRINS